MTLQGSHLSCLSCVQQSSNFVQHSQPPLKKLTLRSKVEVEYLYHKGYQITQYSYNENSNTDISKQLNLESFLYLVLPSIHSLKGKTKSHLPC